MANYIIAGDSWSMGEFAAVKYPNTGILEHLGLQQFLQESGHQVHHLGAPGVSNWDSTKRTAAFLSRHEVDIKAIFAFQVGFERDLDYVYSDKDWSQVTKVENIAGWYLWDYYQRLNAFYTDYNIPVYVVGAKCDTMWFDDFTQHLPGVSIVCQSWYNWLVNDQPSIEQPVYSWFDNTTLNLVKGLKRQFDAQGLEDLLDHIDRGMQREINVRTNREYFWPDGEHPNRKAWQKLYKLLTDKGLV